jgi:polysaccharide export outer membrane protein
MRLISKFPAAAVCTPVALTLLAMASLPVRAQTAPARLPLADGTMNANLPAQKLGPNDLIGVVIYDEPGLSRTVRVSMDGYIRMPMLRDRIKVQGLLPAEVEAVIADALKSAQILVDPVVTVTIAEYTSRPISVVGSVKAPTTFQASEPVSLLDAIARAGGLSPEAGLEILVSQKKQAGDAAADSLLRRIPVKGLLDGTDPQYNILLNGGEEVRVPEMSKLYVLGNVKKPGAFAIQDSGETTVLQMLALTEGLLPYTGKQAFIYRKEGQGVKNEIEIPLRKILDRKAPDVLLAANDILYIPDSRTQRATMSVIEKVVSFGLGTVSGVLIYSSFH